MAIIKNCVRLGVITAVCGIGVAAFMGPQRAGALLSQAQDSIIERIDAHIDDPVALRAELRELEHQYPERISKVRGDLAELDQQIAQLQRDQAVAERVVALADRDLEHLQPLLAEAEAAVNSPVNGIRNVASIRFDNRAYSLDQAYTRANQITQTRIAYANRAADASHDLLYLQTQSEQLADLLSQLETERTQFQAQLWQLDRQVDAIARNESLIDMLEDRQKTIEELKGFDVANLDQMVAKLASVRARQQAELDVLTDAGKPVEYEDLARMQLDSEKGLIGTPELEPMVDTHGGIQTLIYRADSDTPKVR